MERATEHWDNRVPKGKENSDGSESKNKSSSNSISNLFTYKQASGAGSLVSQLRNPQFYNPKEVILYNRPSFKEIPPSEADEIIKNINNSKLGSSINLENIDELMEPMRSVTDFKLEDSEYFGKLKA